MAKDLPFLPYGRQSIDDDDVAAVAAALRSDFLTTGPAVEAFEAAFAARLGARFAVVCSSGTAGLHLAALALDLKEGEAVIVPTITFLATANAARYVGAEVIFADVDAETGLMTAETLTAALAGAGGAPVRAVIPVHLGGQAAPMAEIAAVARGRGLAIAEDACHAVGTTYGVDRGAPVPVGACWHSDMAVFSLHPVKTMTMGEGGVITTAEETVARRLRRLRSHGMTAARADLVNDDLAFDASGEVNPWYYEMPEIGFNYRATDIQCALGLSQLRKLDRFIARRRALVDRYDGQLAPLAPTVRPVGRVAGVAAAWHLYGVLIDFLAAGTTRGAVMRRLRDAGIGSQVHYIPVHEQPYYRRRYGRRRLPGAEAYYARALSLPLFPAMADEDIDRVVDALRQALEDGAEGVRPAARRRGTMG